MTKIFVAGHNGMVGSAICRQLAHKDVEIVTAARGELDLTNQLQVKHFFNEHSFDQVYLAAAKVGGIHANNSYPAAFIYENIMIQANVIHEAHRSNVPKLLFLGSSCIYPKYAPQPITEDSLLSGALEPTNEPYAIAKIAGIKMCESYNRQFGRQYRSVMPTNLYGENDNYHPENSHVIPGLIRRLHEAKLQNSPTVIAWGTGRPLREFLHVEDMASASIFIMNLSEKDYQFVSEPMLSHLNVGSGVEITIKHLTETITDVVGYAGKIIWDSDKPDGSPRKLVDSHKIKSLGWSPRVTLIDGLRATYEAYIERCN